MQWAVLGVGVNLGFLNLPQHQLESLWTDKTFSREENKMVTKQVGDDIPEPNPKEDTNDTRTFIVPMKKDLGSK